MIIHILQLWITSHCIYYYYYLSYLYQNSSKTLVSTTCPHIGPIVYNSPLCRDAYTARLLCIRVTFIIPFVYGEHAPANSRQQQQQQQPNISRLYVLGAGVLTDNIFGTHIVGADGRNFWALVQTVHRCIQRRHRIHNMYERFVT